MRALASAGGDGAIGAAQVYERHVRSDSNQAIRESRRSLPTSPSQRDRWRNCELFGLLRSQPTARQENA
jgi:hypothetical protein